MSADTIATTVRDGRVVWEVEGKPVSVRMTPDVICRLGIAVREGFKALPRRGLETGGLLIGTKRRVGNQVVVDVDDFEAVECEHAAGPSYLLSDPDRRLLESRIAARSGGKTQQVIGFYRSHTRSGFGITMEDNYLFSTYFRKASDVFLLIKSNEGAAPTAGFIIREGGKVLADSPYLQFPFDENIAMSARQEMAIPSPAGASCAVSNAEVPSIQHRETKNGASCAVDSSPRRDFGSFPRIGGWPLWLTIGCATALAVGTWVGFQNRRPIASTTGVSLALHVANTSDGLRLSWNRQASRSAERGILWIQDGRAEHRIELDSHQLREGSVAYWPRSSDVNFRLQLLAPGPEITESVRAIGAPGSREPAPAPAAVAAEIRPSPFAVIQRPVSIEAEMEPERPRRAFRAPEAAPLRASLETANLPSPPINRPATELPTIALPPEAVSLPAVPAAAPPKAAEPRRDTESSSRVSVEPVSASRLEHVARSIPLVGRRYHRADYVPPVPLHSPTIATPLGRSLEHGVTVDVKVYVTAAGKVDYVEVASQVPDAEMDLAAAAMFSARRCEFVPARESGGPVAGELVLRYQFGPGAQR